MDIKQMENLIETCVCGECGAELVIRQNPELGLEVKCGREKRHEGFAVAETAMEVVARESGPPFMTDQLRKRSPLMRQEGRSAVVYELMHRYPDLANEAQATVFLAHAARLELDPFLGQIAPLVFSSKKRSGAKTVVPFPTEKGWATLAQRTEPDEFMGPPGLRPLPDDEKAQWGYDPDDIVYAARGRKRSWPEPGEPLIVAYRAWEQRATSDYAPAKADPHHHARVRATRRWYEQNYPAAAALVNQANTELPAEVTQIIEGEYRLVDEPPRRAVRQTRGKATPVQGPPPSPKTVATLLRAAQDRLGMDERAVLEVLVVSRKEDIGDLGAAWERLQKVQRGA